MSESKIQQRPPAYEHGTYLWRFQDIPKTIERDGKKISNPIRKSAVFVVHGIGNQAYLDTAVTLRDGFEDAIDKMHQIHGQEKVPTPFTLEGYWGNYDDLEKTFPSEWLTFNKREQTLFSNLWKRRAISKIRTFVWFAKQSLRLILDPRILKKVGLNRWLTYCGIALLGLCGFVYMLLRHPGILSTVLGDVRLYLDPRGDIERAIVQRIDRRVGEQFLLLIGLDWDFKTISEDDQLSVGGDLHVFTYVTWVAHSLGSVISYNVISDLFSRCQELKAKLNKPLEALTLNEKQLQQNIKRVEQGLHRFITIGSPLEKVAFLFPSVLRSWPKSYLEGFALANKRHWWTNFFHIWDPVSGRLRNSEYFQVARNAHSSFLRLPIWAHVSYWQDRSILIYIITRTYGPEVLRLPPIEFKSEQLAEIYRRLSLFGIMLISVVAIYETASHWDRLMLIISPGIFKLIGL